MTSIHPMVPKLRLLYRIQFLREKADIHDPVVISRLRELGLMSDTQNSQPSLGSGEFGDVIRSVTSGRVIKLTDDSDEAEVAEMLVGNPQPGIVLVYSVDELQDKAGAEVWAIELEELQLLSKKEMARIDAVVHATGGVIVGGGMTAKIAADVYRREPRLRDALTSCISLGITPDLKGDNIMSRSDGSWVLADLGPIMFS